MDIFERCLAWAYTDQLTQRGEGMNEAGYEMIIGIYPLAELCYIGRVQNATIDFIMGKAAVLHAIPPKTFSRLIYGGSPKALL